METRGYAQRAPLRLTRTTGAAVDVEYQGELRMHETGERLVVLKIDGEVVAVPIATVRTLVARREAL
jgi:hypothetical protein